jgi:predicted RNA-binding protein with PIN domain
LLASSVAVTEHLLRATGAVVLIDGYNVAKLGWPSLELAVQRELLVAAAEDVAKRWGVDITVVFDGATVTGASTPVRRLVRVTFSPAGVSADDVLRAEVAGLDPQRPVVVVTSDQQVVTDVRADGANTIASDQFLAVARR